LEWLESSDPQLARFWDDVLASRCCELDSNGRKKVDAQKISDNESKQDSK
jgi:hypothetical protein